MKTGFDGKTGIPDKIGLLRSRRVCVSILLLGSVT